MYLRNRENASPDKIIPRWYPRSAAMSSVNHDLKSNSSTRATEVAEQHLDQPR